MPGMQTDFIEESKHTVAIVFSNGRPPLYRMDYPEKFWVQVVAQTSLSKSLNHARMVMDDTDEGQAVINGSRPSSITKEFLLGLEIGQLRRMAVAYGESGAGKALPMALKILTAIEEGRKPKQEEEQLAEV
jgi:hypothetical protein